MKKLLTLAVGLGLVFTIAGTASAISNPSDWSDGSIANGIVNSRHNLGSTGLHFQTTNAVTSDAVTNSATGGGGTSEVCIFCHTPHHGATNAPLWNKGQQDAGTYTTYGSTVGGSTISSVGAATLACLSCHNGVNTFDTIVNWPGKGSAGSNDSADTTDMEWVFYEGGKMDAEDDYMTSPRLNLGTDLTNDHPVSVLYSGGDDTTSGDYTNSKASLRSSSTVISSVSLYTDFFTTGNSTTNDSATFAQNIWAVGGYVDNTATITEILRDNQVECSTCHDPHFKNQSWNEVAGTWGEGSLMDGEKKMDGLFLRRIGGNSLSGVCRTCHAK